MNARSIPVWKAGPAAVAAAVLFSAAGTCGEEKGAAEPPPVSPFAPNVQAPPREDARPGAVTLSNGEVVRGLVMFTRGRKLEIFEDSARKWHALDLVQLARIEVQVETEKEEREWRWKENGSDEKVYSGRTYVDRKYLTTLTLAGGRGRITGHVRGTVFYVKPPQGDAQRFFLRHDQRGDFNQKSADLVYPRSVVLEAAEGAEPKAPGAAPQAVKDG